MKLTKFVFAVSVAAVICGFSVGAKAQATRTWVSGVGDDANPCSRTAPCKTFAGAISKTADGGEISVLDPGGYGAVTITKSITINGLGIVGSISVGSILFNSADPSDVVTIRNVSINGAKNGASPNGIRFLGGGKLTLENCDIRGFTGSGISVEASVNTRSLVLENTFLHNNTSGITINPGTGSLAVSLNNVGLHGGDVGLTAMGTAKVSIRSSVVSDNTTAGISSDGSAEINSDNVTVSNNGTGILAGGNSIVRMSNLSIFNNTMGIARTGTTSILASFLNNKIAGNGTNGTPTVNLTNQ